MTQHPVSLQVTLAKYAYQSSIYREAVTAWPALAYDLLHTSPDVQI